MTMVNYYLIEARIFDSNRLRVKYLWDGKAKKIAKGFIVK